MFADRMGEGGATRAEELAGRLRLDGVHGVVLPYVDTAGVTRIKTVPVARLPRAARWGVGMSPVFDVFLSDDSITATDRLGGPDGDLRLVPDLDRLTVLAAQPGWAWAPVDRYTQAGQAWPGCQRGFLRAMTERADAAGLGFTMAIEVEWALGRAGTDEFVAACAGPAYGATRLVELSDYARDLLSALDAQGVEVEQLHPEYADAQFELSVAARDPVGAADDSLLVRQTIRAVSHRHGLRPSFAPSVLAGRVGNGGHVHLSATRDGRNLFTGGPGPHGLTAEAEACAAGILDLLPALLAIGAPSVASYLRLVPSHWAGVFACWGHETREAALRLITGNAGAEDSAANLEVKCVDLAASPYLLLGALIGAALDGRRRELRLPPPVTGDPARFAADDLAGRGIRRLPTSLDEAADAFAAAPPLREALGDLLADAVLAVRRAEAQRLRGASDEEVAAALRWIY
ncbi:L-glutamine synthetase [Krasilnikovia cinnamomea]|uniref:L-glutamine synthetase n=1 Tax=Krasilnikovia cinnamomea TaxID=349313 RepID=A0A4Q7ZT79_9ACTN|nr:glutamine synthetase family protein [Krasilnikovia cinnamomea]RZU54420.1 L-glutamine synthetase [Krasilnikovia cinnamomea]